MILLGYFIVLGEVNEDNCQRQVGDEVHAYDN